MTRGWRQHHGQAIALDQDNIDTDQLIPARFMVTPRSDGYGQFLLHDVRFDETGAPRADMALNQHPKASVLVTGRNFGSGSSREAAVYALVDFGIRAVIAPSFGDIFAGNAVNNGLLPARVAKTDGLLALLAARPCAAKIDLEEQTVTLGNTAMRFVIDPSWREKLINGWDDIDLTQARTAQIAAYRKRREAEAPWVWTETT